MPADHCPPSGQRTERARALARDLAVTTVHRDAVTTWQNVLARCAQDLRYMADRGLCSYCGFPVDRSDPYPREEGT